MAGRPPMSRRTGRRRPFGGPSPEEDVEREIRAHLNLRADELEEAGWSREDARVEAERLFGDRAAIESECSKITESHDRAVRRWEMWSGVLQDVQYAVRTLWRSPGFTLASILTLAVGIGANAAIFSVTYAVLLKPLPYDEPDGLVELLESNNRGGVMAVAWPNFLDWHEEARSYEGMAAYTVGRSTVLGADRPIRTAIASVSQDFWSVFRLAPAQGRFLGPAEHTTTDPSAVVVGHSFWQNELGGVPIDDVVLEVSGERVQVVGVMPPDFDFPSGAEVWGAAEPHGNTSRTSHNWRVVARMNGTTSFEVAEEEIDALTKVIVLQEPDADPDFLATGADATPLRERLVGGSRTPLLLLLGAACLVLLVACTNIASTLLARGTTRARELAIRSSLGAERGRIVRQLLTESVVLATVGGLAGIALAVGLTRLLRVIGPASLPRLDEVAVDARVLLFASAVAAGAALLFGLYPALRLTRDGDSDALRGGRGNTLGHRGPIWRILVGTEVALALVLLAGSGLLVRSFQQILAEDIGVDGDDVAAVEVSLSRLKYETEYDQARWYTELLAELEASPAVRSAGLLSERPAGGTLPNGRLELDGDLSKTTIAGYVVASSGAFEAFDIPLLRGRLFGPQDGPDDAHVVVVSEGFANATWPGEDPIGKQVTGGGMDNFWEDRMFATVVGVVGDVRMRSLSDEPYPTIYWHYMQRPFRIQYGADVVVEAESGDVGSVAGTLRATIERLDSDVPIQLLTLREVIDDALASRRFMMLLLGGFSIVGLLLAAIGIYGVVAYTVARRTREMGIRVALGAPPSSVGAMVIRSSMQLVVGGVVVGLIGAVFAARLLQGLLYGVAPGDPLTLGLVTALLVGTALLASWVPARTGTRTDPMITMRSE